MGLLDEPVHIAQLIGARNVKAGRLAALVGFIGVYVVRLNRQKPLVAAQIKTRPDDIDKAFKPADIKPVFAIPPPIGRTNHIAWKVLRIIAPILNRADIDIANRIKPGSPPCGDLIS